MTRRNDENLQIGMFDISQKQELTVSSIPL